MHLPPDRKADEQTAVNATWISPTLRYALDQPSPVTRHRETGQDILLVHGHQGDFPNDRAWRFSRLMMRVFWRYDHAFGFHSPTSPVANSDKRHKVERNHVRWIRQNRMALICGHTHRERFPRANAMPYFNSGSCVHPSHITALEIVGGTIALVRWPRPPLDRGNLPAWTFAICLTDACGLRPSSVIMPPPSSGRPWWTVG